MIQRAALWAHAGLPAWDILASRHPADPVVADAICDQLERFHREARQRAERT